MNLLFLGFFGSFVVKYCKSVIKEQMIYFLVMKLESFYSSPQYPQTPVLGELTTGKRIFSSHS